MEEKEQVAVWPDGSSGTRTLDFFVATGEPSETTMAHLNAGKVTTGPQTQLEIHGDRLIVRPGRNESVPVLPASVSEELAEHLSNCLAIIDGESRVGPDDEARRFLNNYRAEVESFDV